MLLPCVQAFGFHQLSSFQLRDLLRIQCCIWLSIPFPRVCLRQFLCPPCSSAVLTFLKSFSLGLSNVVTDETEVYILIDAICPAASQHLNC